MNTSATLIKAKDILLIEQMGVLRSEFDALAIDEFIGLNRVVIGKIKQQFSSTMFWYQQWAKNRDYSSVTNAAMAMGKLSSLIEIFPCAVENNSEMAALFDSVNAVFSQCWESIEKASGRIIPTEDRE